MSAKSSRSVFLGFGAPGGRMARLREQPGAPGVPGGGSAAQPGSAGSPAELTEPAILCRDCLHPVTRPAERIAVDGSHRHTFANPHGVVFEIGCFRTADGCARVGPRSEEFTWFAGHSWQVGLCAACLAHLGWHFASPGGGEFYGLILERLVEKD